MTTNYIPRADDAFDTWQSIFIAYLVPNATALGIDVSLKTELTTAATDWTATFNDHLNAQNAAQGARAAKQEAKVDYESVIREAVRIIQANPAVTDIQRAALGITIPKPEPTPIPVPTLTPLIFIDFGKRFMHIVHWGPNPTNETNNAKPEGVASCEIRFSVAPSVPTNPDEMHILTVDSASPAVNSLLEHPGQNVWYVVRYLNAKGEPGPWSAFVNAEVTGGVG